MPGDPRPEPSTAVPLTANDEGERLAADLQATLGGALERLRRLAADLAADAPARVTRRLEALAEEAGAAQDVLAEAMVRLARGAGRSGRGAAGDERSPVRVVVVDEQPVVRRGVAAALIGEPGVVFAGEAHSVEAAVDIAARARPDVVLVDYRLPDMCAPEAAPRLRAAMPGARLVLFTAERGAPALEAALRAGFDGCVLKDTPMAGVVDAVRRVAAGETVLDPRLRPVAAGASRPRAAPPLTRREYEVLRRVAMGETNEEIARAIGLSRNTVKTYLQTALGKLGARNRIEALARATEAGLL